MRGPLRLIGKIQPGKVSLVGLQIMDIHSVNIHQGETRPPTFPFPRHKYAVLYIGKYQCRVTVEKVPGY